jgi:hypothetical protein
MDINLAIDVMELFDEKAERLLSSPQLSSRTSLTTSAVSRDTFPVRAATAALGCCGAGDTFLVGV